MESATILMPPGTGLSGILFPSEPNIPEGPELPFLTNLTEGVLSCPGIKYWTQLTKANF